MEKQRMKLLIGNWNLRILEWERWCRIEVLLIDCEDDTCASVTMFICASTEVFYFLFFGFKKKKKSITVKVTISSWLSLSVDGCNAMCSSAGAEISVLGPKLIH